MWRMLSKIAVLIVGLVLVISIVAYTRGEMGRSEFLGVVLVAVLTALNAGVNDTIRASEKRNG